MAAKSTTSAQTSVQPITVEQVMEMLRQPKQPKVSLTTLLADRIADSGNNLARIGAGFSAATDNMADAYTLEKERQLRRRAERLVELANAVR